MASSRQPLRRTLAAAELRPVDRDLFRTLLGWQPATVTVVTAPGLAANRHLPALPPAGFTATSFTSVSPDPPLVSFRLDGESSSWPTVERAEHLAVHLLASRQQEAARTFATSGIDRFAIHPGWTLGPLGVPLIDDALAVLLCRVVRRSGGDDTIVLGEPLALRTREDFDPLVQQRGGHTTTFGPWPSPWWPPSAHPLTRRCCPPVPARRAGPAGGVRVRSLLELMP